jgi:hypothetical protein
MAKLAENQLAFEASRYHPAISVMTTGRPTEPKAGMEAASALGQRPHRGGDLCGLSHLSQDQSESGPLAPISRCHR